MRCENCNEEIPPGLEICPKCGTYPGTTESISGLMKKHSHRHLERKERRSERKEERKKKCERCGREIEAFMEECPFCGAPGGAAETIGDFKTPMEESRDSRENR